MTGYNANSELQDTDAVERELHRLQLGLEQGGLSPDDRWVKEEQDKLWRRLRQLQEIEREQKRRVKPPRPQTIPKPPIMQQQPLKTQVQERPLAQQTTSLWAKISLWLARRFRPAKRLPMNQPPEFGQYLLWYLPRKDRETVMGDLEEEFGLVYKQFGRRKAVAWYYFQVGASFWPYAVRACKKLFTWGVFGWIAETLRRFIS
jgi:hypothetical protein